MTADIDFIEEPITYESFYNNYLKKNKPCLFASKFTEAWPCRKLWASDGKLSLCSMKKTFGNATVPVVDCSKKFFSSHQKTEQTMNEFLSYWENRDDKILYLKDWHCQRDFPNLSIYKVPEYFQSDWLNEYWDRKENCFDDYRFVYIGVKNSWTPFHADVFRSYSWSANICGLKKWLLFPPGTEMDLKDTLGNLPYDIEEFLKTFNSSVKPIVLYQNEGEILFVPSGWHHQVQNIKDTVSINHNWINATSITAMFDYICEELTKVKHEIRDCIDMDGFLDQCQLILNASVGIDFKEFSQMLLFLGEKRLNILRTVLKDNDEKCDNLMNETFITSIPKDHSYRPQCDIKTLKEFLDFDLIKIKEVLCLVLKHPDTSFVLPVNIFQEISLFVQKVEGSLKSHRKSNNK